jgi:hypothetical protein
MKSTMTQMKGQFLTIAAAWCWRTSRRKEGLSGFREVPDAGRIADCLFVTE